MGIPEEFYGATSLQNLFLSSNKLSGTISKNIGQLTKLLVLWLDDNSLSGKIPNEISALGDLEDLYLNDNALTGMVPPMACLTWTSMSNLWVDCEVGCSCC